MTKRHVLDGEYVPRCNLCLQRGHRCNDYELPKRWGVPIDHCPYYTSLRVQLDVTPSVGG